MVVLSSRSVSVCPLTGCRIDNRFWGSHRLPLLVPLERHRNMYTNPAFPVFNYRTVARLDGRFLLIMYAGTASSVDESHKAFFCFEAEGRDEKERAQRRVAFLALRRDNVSLRTFAELLAHIDRTYDRVTIDSICRVDARGRVALVQRLIRPRK